MASFFIIFVSFVFLDWLVETEKDKQFLPFENLHEDVLADLLGEFYYGARSKKNECYSRSALKGLCAGIQRHLEAEAYCRKINLPGIRHLPRQIMSSQDI